MTDVSIAIAEATTVKHRARALLRDIEALLTDKGLTEEQTKPLRALHDRLKGKWSDLTAPESTAEAALPRLALEVAAILAQDDSFDSIRMAVQTALRKRAVADKLAQMAGDGNGGADLSDMAELYDCPWPWIRDIYPDTVVYEQDGDLYRCAYTINDDESVTLGPPIEVDIAYVPAPDADDSALPTTAVTIAAESNAPTAESIAEAELSGDIVPLIEKAVRTDGTMRIKLIQPGWGSSAYYSEAVLKRDGPKVFPSGTQMFWDHQTATEEAERPEGSLRDLAAVFTSDAAWDDNGPAGKGLYADATAIDGWRDVIEGLAPHIGTSIRSWGRTVEGEAEGQQGPILQAFTSGRSVDFVTRAGAGGEIVQLFEAARTRPTSPQGDVSVDEKQAQVLREAMAGLEKQNEEMRAMIARQNEALVLRDARDLITEVLAESEMPDLTRKRLADDLIKRPAMKDGQLDRDAMVTQTREAVKAELTYLAQATGGTGQIKGMGSNGVISPAWQEQAEKKLAGGLGRLGLSESAASVAARGR